MIGATTVSISGSDYAVNFNMQHKSMRVRLKIITEPKLGDKIGAYIQGTVYGTVYPDGDIFRVYDGMYDTRSNVRLNVNPTYTYNGINGTETATGGEYLSPYQYILPSPSAVSNLSTYKIHFNSGKIFGRSLAGKEINLSSAALPSGYTEAYNSSVTIKVTVKIPPHYLFQDGTVGTLKNKGTRTPIGLVVTEKEGSNPGLAVALNFRSFIIWEASGEMGAGNTYQNNKVCYPNPQAGMADMNGYNWTWDPASSLDGKTRGNEQTQYPAFYVAGHYNPGITVTGGNVGKWFLPSFGQLVEFVRLTNPDFTAPAVGSIPTMAWNTGDAPLSDKSGLTKLHNCLKQGGGIGFLNVGTFFCSTSTQVDGSVSYRKYQPTAMLFYGDNGPGQDRVGINAIWKTMSNGGVLPFVHF